MVHEDIPAQAHMYATGLKLPADYRDMALTACLESSS